MSESPKEQDNQQGFAPPYVSFKTFIRVLDRMREEGVPPRIDRTWLTNMSGSQQTQTLQALRAFGLIGDGGKVDPQLSNLVGKDRKNYLNVLLQGHYAELIDLGSKNATQGQMEEWFKQFKYSRPTIAKAVSFFLQAATEAGVSVSPYFKPVSLGGSAPPRRKKLPHHRENRTTGEQPADPDPTATDPKQRYLDMLLKKAEDEPTPELLDRIERLLGYDTESNTK